MKQVDEMPTSGQFVAVVDIDGIFVATTYKYIDDDLHFLNSNSDLGVLEWQELDKNDETEYLVGSGYKTIYLIAQSQLN